jgi:4-amino-4-deoxy-L-arabinose transferase-like glycosyltransferase
VHALLWGAWLLVLAGSFSVSSSANPYYTAALAPPVAALVAAGSVSAWRSRQLVAVRITVVATVIGSVAYALWLLPSSGTGLPSWLAVVVVILGAVAVTGVAAPPGRVRAGVAQVGLVGLVGLVASTVTLLAVPVVASASIPLHRLGPFDTPFQPVAVTAGTRSFFGVTTATKELIPTLERVRRGARYLMATETSALAAPFIFVTGQEVLPIGGYTGTIPAPTLDSIRSLVRSRRFHLVLQSPTATDPRFVWIANHCLPVAQPTSASAQVRHHIAIFYCLTSS